MRYKFNLRENVYHFNAISSQKSVKLDLVKAKIVSFAIQEDEFGSLLLSYKISVPASIEGSERKVIVVPERNVLKIDPKSVSLHRKIKSIVSSNDSVQTSNRLVSTLIDKCGLSKRFLWDFQSSGVSANSSDDQQSSKQPNASVSSGEAAAEKKTSTYPFSSNQPLDLNDPRVLESCSVIINVPPRIVELMEAHFVSAELPRFPADPCVATLLKDFSSGQSRGSHRADIDVLSPRSDVCAEFVASLQTLFNHVICSVLLTPAELTHYHKWITSRRYRLVFQLVCPLTLNALKPDSRLPTRPELPDELDGKWHRSLRHPEDAEGPSGLLFSTSERDSDKPRGKSSQSEPVPTEPALLFGIEYLVRLFDILPLVFTHMEASLPPRRLDLILKLSHLFLNYLDRRCSHVGIN